MMTMVTKRSDFPLTPAGLVMLLSLCLTACTSTQIIKANSTPAKQSTEQIPPELLLDIGIMPLDPGIPSSDEAIEKNMIVPDVRRAESQFIAYHLKDTLELTGNWGAVRVIPEPSEAVDLTITGKILLSDGERLQAKIKATDSRGRTWINDTYEDVASKYSYDRVNEDPFQDFYNDIANDLLKVRSRMDQSDIAEIRETSRLKYANDLSPDAFGQYLDQRGKRTAVKQLPSEDNAMLARVDRIKQREYLFIDTLDDYYGKFYREMKPSYNEWRHATYDEAVRLRMMQEQARNRLLGGAALIAGGIYASGKSGTYAGQTAAVGAVAGGIGTIKSGLDRRAEAEIHEESLRELSQSLGSEITPYVLDIEGRTIELTGTADAQYQQWRKILKEIYAKETGLPVK
jgi:hypothetical protein